MSYVSNSKIKYVGDLDTISFNDYEVDLVRTEDKVFGGHIWIKKDASEKFFDGQNIYSISGENKVITKHPNGEIGAIVGGPFGKSIQNFLLDIEKLKGIIQDTTIKVDVIPSQIKAHKVWELTMAVTGEEHQEFKFLVDKKNYQIHRITQQVGTGIESQFALYNFDKIQYTSTTEEDLLDRFNKIKSSYESKDEVYEEIKLLPKGSKFPPLSGTLYKQNTMRDIKAFKSDFLLIDFWYIDCPPCINAIPHLNALSKSYSNKELQVIGVNPFNNNEKDLSRLPNFLSKHEMSYPIMFIDKEAPPQYKVKAYPTAYLLDSNREILYATIGFNASTSETIDSLIRVHLGK